MRFTLTRGELAELPYQAADRVRPGDVIEVSGWRVAIENVVRDATSHSAGLLTGYVRRTAPLLGPSER